ncbi:deoxyribonuclease 1 like 4, tandem duplicate 1 isoform 2-T2 [Clarias gariepinus]|uniref:deoxyribonuclease 1 like 4, tandem duplicate 1 isoform X2 n=1 Tax=Clarias gariepinus TaxID=13013 RepID=UPI00234C8E4D|nr:deoxyribonuclease 1 like 4, tandem duplicate 1 isoform X2 [Clarias gariepinus]
MVRRFPVLFGFDHLEIVSRYDIVVVLEVVDASKEAVNSFLTELNKANPQHHYSMQLSVRLGRTKYKEQFMFLYRDAVVKVTDTYQYEEKQPGDEDVFDREPYILQFSLTNTVVKDLVLIPVHTKPEDSVKELKKLYDVVLEMKKKWKTDNIMILGDFNADGRYMSKKERKALSIFTDKNFHWLIIDEVDTTTSTKNDHTYDRIVVYEQVMLDGIVPNSARAFNFQREYGLTEADALKVSDHYSVEVELKINTDVKPLP